MSWTRAPDLMAQVQKSWDRGDLLRHSLHPGDLFPLKLKLKTPSSSELADRFENVREWIDHINSLKNYRIEVREFTHRVLGRNVIPESAWIEDQASAIAILGKQREQACYQDLVHRLTARLPELVPWVTAHPIRALSFATDWSNLLATTEWIKLHPCPNIYLRQVDIPGMHTKFIESNTGILSEWFDLALPTDQINRDYSASTGFAERYGFRTKPAHVRFRPLDPLVWPSVHGSHVDASLDSATFAALELNPQYVFITEN